MHLVVTPARGAAVRMLDRGESCKGIGYRLSDAAREGGPAPAIRGRTMRSSARLRLGAWSVASVVLALALSASSQAQPQDQDDDAYDNGHRSGHDDRRSTWEPSTSLVFKRYLEPFP